MKSLIIIASLFILLLSGCSTVSIKMKVDSTLADNAIVYDVIYPDSFKDKISGNMLNISFGPYKVIDTDLSWTTINSKAEDPRAIFSSKKTKKTKNATTTTEISGGPASILGFSRPYDENEPTINERSRSLNYKFVIANHSEWSANCRYISKERITNFDNVKNIEMLASNFTCEYKKLQSKLDNEIWILLIDDIGTITMTQKGRLNKLSAYQTDGVYVKSNAEETNLSVKNAGYTWSEISDENVKNIAAVSVREETPRIFLDKGNEESLNHILSMANTGLLIYSWEIKPIR